MLIVFIMTALLTSAVGFAVLSRMHHQPVPQPIRVEPRPGVRILVDRAELSRTIARATTFDREAARRIGHHVARYQDMDEPRSVGAPAPDHRRGNLSLGHDSIGDGFEAPAVPAFHSADEDTSTAELGRC